MVLSKKSSKKFLSTNHQKSFRQKGSRPNCCRQKSSPHKGCCQKSSFQKMLSCKFFLIKVAVNRFIKKVFVKIILWNIIVVKKCFQESFHKKIIKKSLLSKKVCCNKKFVVIKSLLSKKVCCLRKFVIVMYVV